jgi:hypothetical protein
MILVIDSVNGELRQLAREGDISSDDCEGVEQGYIRLIRWNEAKKTYEEASVTIDDEENYEIDSWSKVA